MLRFSSHVFFLAISCPTCDFHLFGVYSGRIQIKAFIISFASLWYFCRFQVVFMVWIRVLMNKPTIDVAVLLLAARSIACQILLSAGVQTLMSMGDFVALSGAWALIPRPTTLSHNFDQVTSLSVSFSPALCFFWQELSWLIHLASPWLCEAFFDHLRFRIDGTELLRWHLHVWSRWWQSCRSRGQTKKLQLPRKHPENLNFQRFLRNLGNWVVENCLNFQCF